MKLPFMFCGSEIGSGQHEMLFEQDFFNMGSQDDTISLDYSWITDDVPSPEFSWITDEDIDITAITDEVIDITDINCIEEEVLLRECFKNWQFDENENEETVDKDSDVLSFAENNDLSFPGPEYLWITDDLLDITGITDDEIEIMEMERIAEDALLLECMKTMQYDENEDEEVADKDTVGESSIEKTSHEIQNPFVQAFCISNPVTQRFSRLNPLASEFFTSKPLARGLSTLNPLAKELVTLNPRAQEFFPLSHYLVCMLLSILALVSSVSVAHRILNMYKSFARL